MVENVQIFSGEGCQTDIWFIFNFEYLHELNEIKVASGDWYVFHLYFKPFLSVNVVNFGYFYTISWIYCIRRRIKLIIASENDSNIAFVKKS